MISTIRPSTKKESESSRAGSAGVRFRSILVATDCSPASEMAVKYAARLAKQSHARLAVLHSIAPQVYPADSSALIPELAVLDLEKGRKNLHNYVERIGELRTVKHTEEVFFGTPREAIESVVEDGVDLLVLGSHGRHGLAKLTLGSVAEWAIRRLKYPVLVAGPMCLKSLRPIQSVLLAMDLAQETSRAVQYASALAQEYTARLTLMSALPEGHAKEEQSLAEASARHKLRQLISSTCDDRGTHNYEVMTGDIAPAILQAAQKNNADVIVLGAKHRAPLADHRPRTKLSAIIRGSHCPVLLIPD